ncbi:hypothetical protein, partial [uncultured Alistipes sp.]|uniref:hypothetical protein n=1 Tax=uncultured Alistipes sp. TaxID=538949 RepID=UPI0026292622
MQRVFDLSNAIRTFVRSLPERENLQQGPLPPKRKERKQCRPPPAPPAEVRNERSPAIVRGRKKAGRRRTGTSREPKCAAHGKRKPAPIPPRRETDAGKARETGRKKFLGAPTQKAHGEEPARAEMRSTAGKGSPRRSPSRRETDAGKARETGRKKFLGAPTQKAHGE